MEQILIFIRMHCTGFGTDISRTFDRVGMSLGKRFALQKRSHENSRESITRANRIDYFHFRGWLEQYLVFSEHIASMRTASKNHVLQFILVQQPCCYFGQFMGFISEKIAYGNYFFIVYFQYVR